MDVDGFCMVLILLSLILVDFGILGIQRLIWIPFAFEDIYMDFDVCCLYDNMNVMDFDGFG